MASHLDFEQWQWELAGLVGSFAIAATQKAWHNHQQRRSENWPISYGHVLVAAVEDKDKKTMLTLDYSYRVGGEVHTGSFKKTFDDADDAQLWADALSHKQVPVRYDGDRPSRSRLREGDLEPIVRGSAPFQATDLQNEQPGLDRALATIGFYLALAGVAGCIVLVTEGIVGKPLLPPWAATFLNIGSFVVFGLAALLHWIGKRHAKTPPEWMKYLGYALLYYVVFSFALVPSNHSRTEPHTRAPARQERTHQDARYQLLLYFAGLEWCYVRMHAEALPDHFHGSLHERSLS